MSLIGVTAFKASQKQALIRKNFAEIYEHEAAHKRAAGSLGGPIVIESNSEGIPVSGHVSIKMPKLNERNPQETIDNADIVIKSAMAPSDPSAQDYKVANEAKTIKHQAENIKAKKGLDYYA